MLDRLSKGIATACHGTSGQRNVLQVFPEWLCNPANRLQHEEPARIRFPSRAGHFRRSRNLVSVGLDQRVRVGRPRYSLLDSFRVHQSPSKDIQGFPRYERNHLFSKGFSLTAHRKRRSRASVFHGILTATIIVKGHLPFWRTALKQAHL